MAHDEAYLTRIAFQLVVFSLAIEYQIFQPSRQRLSCRKQQSLDVTVLTAMNPDSHAFQDLYSKLLRSVKICQNRFGM